MENDSALTSGEAAFFETGGATDHGAGDSAAGADAGKAAPTGGEGQPGAAEQAQPGNEDAAGGEQKPKQQQEKTVPLAALHQARAEIRETKERFTQLEQRNAQMERVFQQFMAQQEQAQAPQIPAADADPIAHFTMTQQQLQNQIQHLQQQLQAQGQQTQQQWQEHQQQQQVAQQQQQFVNRVNHSVNEFKQTHADFDEASNYLKEQLANDLALQGVENVNAAVDQQIVALVHSAMNVGLSPAQLAYQMAMSRGYKQKQAAPAAPAGQDNAGKIAQINKGQAAAKSLSSTGGKGKAELTLEAMAEMSDEELSKQWDQIRIQKLM